MLRTRLLATAFLINGDRVLLMKRSSHARLFPDRWAPIGGHIETDEINDPQVACLREIREETGLRPHHIAGFALRYIIHRRRDHEIRTQYVYFGLTREEHVGKTDEGELHWVRLDEVAGLDVSATTRFALEHYTRNGSQSADVYVGTVDAHDGQPPLPGRACAIGSECSTVRRPTPSGSIAPRRRSPRCGPGRRR